MNTSSRRGFLGGAAALAAAGAATPLPAAAQSGPGDLKLAIASYSFREFQRSAAIRMTKQLGIKYLSVKEFHLPYSATPAERERARTQIANSGIELLSGGVIYMQKNDEAEIKSYFDYAKDCGMGMMIIAPSAASMPTIEKYVKQYNIKVALHNHGPEDKHIPNSRDAMKLIKDMDPRVGLCIDIGHEVRTGVDLIESIELAGSRLLDFHIKDLKDKTKASSQVPVGDGVLPVVGMFKALRKMNYQHTVTLEYEIDAADPLLGMSKSFAYMRGVIAGLNG